MLHAKFQDYRDSDYDKKILKLFTIYGRGSRLIVHLACHNLGHAILGNYTNFRSQSGEDA